MMGLVRLALRRPYTSAIAAFIIMLAGAMSMTRMIVDIFPIIDIPVVLVAWSYGGLSAEDMERRVVLSAERSYSQTVNGVEHIESTSIPGVGLIKIFFHPGIDIGAAIAQIDAVDNTALRVMPPGMQPPNIIQFNASNVGVVQLTSSSRTMPEQDIVDYTQNFIRLRLFTIPGISLTGSYGGKQRQVIVDLDPMRLSAKGVSPNDVVLALQTSNVILPAGVARIGGREYNVATNSSPPEVAQFARLPVVVRNGIPVTLGDVAKISDSFATQSNIVHVNGERATYMVVMRHSDASTLAVVEATKALMPEIRAAAPQGLDLSLDFDQSVFVRAAIDNGMEIDTITVLRQLPRNSRIISETRIDEITASCTTLLIAERTNTDWSKSSDRSSPFGAAARISGIRALVASTTASVEASLWRITTM